MQPNEPMFGGVCHNGPLTPFVSYLAHGDCCYSKGERERERKGHIGHESNVSKYIITALLGFACVYVYVYV